jgi:Fic family protein
MHKTLHALEGFLYAPSELPPLIRLAMIHYQFEAIHPFLDGNGRIGRLLMTLLLCDWNLLPEPLLYLSAYFEAHRQDYYSLLLGVSQNGAWQEWLTFFLRGVLVQSHDSVVRAQRLRTLRKDYRERFQTTRAAARLLQVVDLLFSRPVFTVPELSNALQVNYPTAMRYVNRLIEAEVLREITGQVRNRVYQADGILQALEESFS